MSDPMKSFLSGLQNIDVKGLVDNAQQLANSAGSALADAGAVVGDTAGRIGAGVSGAAEGFLKGFNQGGEEAPMEYGEANEEMADLLEELEFEEASEAETPDAGVSAGPAFVDDEVRDTMDQQDREAEEFAKKFLLKAIRLRGVKIDRAAFLRQELLKKGLSETQVDLAIAERPAVAGVDPEVLDAIARESIVLETNKSSWMSFAAGLPGGLAMVGTIPADITQYYVHAFRIMQKVAYLYGWDDFLEDVDDTDDETLAKLAFFFGVMVGVGSAAAGLKAFANSAGRAVAKNVARAALTKTTWYPILKSVLRAIGVKVTKVGVGKAVGKVVPLVGGVVSGAMTYVTLKNESGKLLDQLKKLPQAQPVPEVVVEEDEVVEEE
ncbi:hypothetical protein [Granulimonas faecalis]|uniref:hypothetical protein n=1 Tax=Granulimonas faecalis TaxID=2894155 RepID=UPI00351370D5